MRDRKGLYFNQIIGHGYISIKVFQTQRNVKFMPLCDGPYQLHERINSNTYKITIPSKYQGHNIFNECNISLFDILKDNKPMNLRLNYYHYEEHDTI